MITIYTDGSGPHGNGIGSASFVVVRNDAITYFYADPVCDKMVKVIGGEKVTNNIAEYLSVYKALDYALQNGHNEVQIFTDSQLVVKQFNREYQAKNNVMYALLKSINELISEHSMHVTISWVPRTNRFIQEADKYGRQCIKVGRMVMG